MDLSHFVIYKTIPDRSNSNRALLYVETAAGRVPFSRSEWEDLLKMDPAEYNRVADFCRIQLLPCMTRSTVNFDFTSYGIKHAVEHEIGFYVSNGTVKLFLAESGIPGRSRGFQSPNLSYPLSKRLYLSRFRR